MDMPQSAWALVARKADSQQTRSGSEMEMTTKMILMVLMESTVPKRMKGKTRMIIMVTMKRRNRRQR